MYPGPIPHAINAFDGVAVATSKTIAPSVDSSPNELDGSPGYALKLGPEKPMTA